TIQTANIDLSVFGSKAGEKFGDEVGFLQAFLNGQEVDITATRVGGGITTSIDNSGIGVKFTADRADGDYKFNITGAFDELRFSARPYANPVSPQPTVLLNGKTVITDSSDYLVQQLTYSGITDQPVIQFSNPEYVVREDGTPILAVTVIRSGGLEGPASATVNLSNGTATAPADYNNSPITVNFANGQTSQVITIPIVDDTLVEPEETVNLTLVNPSPGATIGTQSTAILTILDNDVPPPPKPLVFVAALDPTAGEPGRTDNSGDGTFQFARTGGDITQALTIQYTTTGTATPGADYAALSGTVTIAAGQSVSAPVSFTPLTDGINEPVETVTVKILEDLPYQVGSADTATVRVLDNDPLTGTPTNTLRVLRYNSSGAFVTSYNTITEAVAAAVANDIIVPQAGFYAEPSTVTIDKPLTIRGANAGVSPGSGSTVPPSIISTAPNIPVFTVLPGVSNVTIEGMTIQLGGDNSNGIRVQGPNINNLVVRQNVFNGQGPFNGGVLFLDSGGSGGSASIIDNLIRDVSTNPGSTTSGVQAFRQETIRVTDNVIANLTGPGIAADAITNPASIITNNRVTNAGEQGIQLAGGSARIENNEIADTNLSQGIDRAGIRLRNSGFGTTLGTVNVRSNLITNSYNGVAIREGTPVPASLTVNFNNLVGNTNAALYHGGTGTLDATNNWWDSATGPVVGGTGRNAIAGPSANLVTFAPFATTPF
ncbi:MAG TPA: Calx-beta domain-containing protein, partial [Phormidium sp.]